MDRMLPAYLGNQRESRIVMQLIRYTFSPDAQFVLVSVSGTPVLEDFCQATCQLVADHRFNSRTAIVCDFSNADLGEIHARDFLEYVTFVKNKVLISRRHSRVALVGTNLANSVLLQLFTTVVKYVNIRVFPKSNEAIAWAMERDDEQRPREIVAPVHGQWVEPRVLPG